MAQLPTGLTLSAMQTRWKALLDPILANIFGGGLLLNNVQLINGSTVVPHKLGRQMQGWAIADVQAAATIYRSAPFNPLTLTLTSNAAVTVNLWVF